MSASGAERIMAMNAPAPQPSRMWQYATVDSMRWPRMPRALEEFLNGMDISGWEFVAQVGEELVFRRRCPAPQTEAQKGIEG